MVSSYVPEAGDIVFLDFDPQVGREQAKRRPAMVLTDQRYNRASGLVVVCPLTSKRKPYTDGLVEVHGKHGELYSAAQLTGALQKRAHLPAGELLDGLLEEVRAFSVQGFTDDVCLLGIDYVTPSPSKSA